MCNEQRYSESGAPIAPTRCAEYIALKEELEFYKERFNYSQCIYCGDELAVDAITLDRWRTCPEHPARKENARLREALTVIRDSVRNFHGDISAMGRCINNAYEVSNNALKEAG